MAREGQLRSDDAADELTTESYVELVGSLMYLMTCTRPDLAQAVGALLWFVSNRGRQHWSAQKVLRYVAGALDFGSLDARARRS
jgi:hypothetical protein